MECFNCNKLSGCKETSLEKVKQRYLCHKWEPIKEQSEYQARVDAFYKFGDTVILVLITKEDS